MAELGLRERLQPSLLDRLIDHDRLLTLFELTLTRSRLRERGIAERDLRALLLAQGLTAGPPAEPHTEEGDLLRLRFWASSGRVGVTQLNALVIKQRDATEISLGDLVEVQARNIVNETAETPEQRQAVARRLREIVSRDIGWLLNTTPMEMVTDLESLPRVRHSVLNYGLPSPVGKYASSVDRQRLMEHIQAVIRAFEPRLFRVRVSPDTERPEGDGHALALRIDAQLWAQPAPFQVVLHTSIDLESGKASINDVSAS